MKLTKTWLKNRKACPEAIIWYQDQENKDDICLIKKLLKGEDGIHLDWINWYLSRRLSRMNKIHYAVYAANQVLHIYEAKYPDDRRPRDAIKAAKAYIRNPSTANRVAANAAFTAAYTAYLAANAAYLAANAAYLADAANAAYTAAYTAYIAAYASANAAAYLAANLAAYAWSTYAASAYASANAASDARETIQIKIVKYGLTLLKTEHQESA